MDYNSTSDEFIEKLDEIKKSIGRNFLLNSGEDDCHRIINNLIIMSHRLKETEKQAALTSKYARYYQKAKKMRKEIYRGINMISREATLLILMR